MNVIEEKKHNVVNTNELTNTDCNGFYCYDENYNTYIPVYDRDFNNIEIEVKKNPIAYDVMEHMYKNPCIIKKQ